MNYEVEIEFMDGTKDVFFSFDLAVLMRALDTCEIESFTIRQRQELRIEPHPTLYETIQAYHEIITTLAFVGETISHTLTIGQAIEAIQARLLELENRKRNAAHHTLSRTD